MGVSRERLVREWLENTDRNYVRAKTVKNALNISSHQAGYALDRIANDSDLLELWNDASAASALYKINK